MDPITWLLLALKWAAGRMIDVVIKAAALAFKHWRIVLPVAIVVLGLWRIHALTGQRDEARQIYAKHIAADMAAKEQRRIDNTAKYLRADAMRAIEMAKHESTMTTLRIKYEKLQGDKAIADRSLGNFRERVRLDTERIAASGLSGLLETTGQPSESGGDCDTTALGKAYETLELACAITTEDYNALRIAWDDDCDVFGCRENLLRNY
jgi:hypothetical protein